MFKRLTASRGAGVCWAGRGGGAGAESVAEVTLERCVGPNHTKPWGPSQKFCVSSLVQRKALRPWDRLMASLE